MVKRLTDEEHEACRKACQLIVPADMYELTTSEAQRISKYYKKNGEWLSELYEYHRNFRKDLRAILDQLGIPWRIEKSKKSAKKSVVEKIKEYCLVSNDSGDYYVIPANKRNHWYNKWMYSEDYENGETPVYAKYVQSEYLVFTGWRTTDGN